MITSYAGACDVAAVDGHKQNSTFLKFLLDSYPAPAGIYPIGRVGSMGSGSGLDTQADFRERDVSCGSLVSKTATSGTIVLATSNSIEMVGTFDPMFDTAHVTGSFTAPICVDGVGSAGSAGGQCTP